MNKIRNSNQKSLQIISEIKEYDLKFVSSDKIDLIGLINKRSLLAVLTDFLVRSLEFELIK